MSSAWKIGTRRVAAGWLLTLVVALCVAPLRAADDPGTSNADPPRWRLFGRGTSANAATDPAAAGATSANPPRDNRLFPRLFRSDRTAPPATATNPAVDPFSMPRSAATGTNNNPPRLLDRLRGSTTRPDPVRNPAGTYGLAPKYAPPAASSGLRPWTGPGPAPYAAAHSGNGAGTSPFLPPSQIYRPTPMPAPGDRWSAGRRESSLTQPNAYEPQPSTRVQANYPSPQPGQVVPTDRYPYGPGEGPPLVSQEQRPGLLNPPADSRPLPASRTAPLARGDDGPALVAPMPPTTSTTENPPEDSGRRARMGAMQQSIMQDLQRSGTAR